jgi:hypothetical protein
LLVLSQKTDNFPLSFTLPVLMFRSAFSHIILFLFLSFSAPYFLQAQIPVRETRAIPALEKIKIDGVLDESVWKDAPGATDFFTYEPTIGEPARFRTRVKVLFDDNALYIGAILFDPSPDSILKELSQRDQGGANADFFWITINPYRDGQNIFRFEVSAANVQTDIKITSGRHDRNWDAVWESHVQITEFGWVVEMAIPFSAIRFPKGEEHNWDVNFWRNVRRTREISSWNFVDRTKRDPGSQDGRLTGIRDIKTPFRLSLFPYVSGYVENNPIGNTYAYSAGMDLKYGISESFTLDLTLVPDFGQRKSDDQILNLSPFEVRYGENRQFFTEGTELFTKAGIFYSRRVGKRPSGYSKVSNQLEDKEVIISNPDEAQLRNATKITGRSANGVGIGFFNAMTRKMAAVIEDEFGNQREYETEPFTNYNMLVYDKVFRKYSNINFINTNFYQPSSRKIANVTGTSFKIADNSNLFSFQGTGAYSMRYDTISDKTATGYHYDLNVGKISGTWQYGYGIIIMSNTYNPNDMGYLSRNNDFSQELEARYQVFVPKGRFLNWRTDFSLRHSQLHQPRELIDTRLRLSFNATFRNYYSIGSRADYRPLGYYDHYEPRVPGRYFLLPASFEYNIWMSSDYRKKISYNTSGNIHNRNGLGIYFAFNPRFRLSDKLNFNHQTQFSYTFAEHGYISQINSDSIVFGERDKRTITNTLSGAFVFNNKSAITLNLRHYWSLVDYTGNYYLLNDNGLLSAFYYEKDDDINFNTFNIDLIYSWNFAPGSSMNFMWKNSIYDREVGSGITNEGFIDNLNNTLGLPQTNNFSIKISYYLDYKYLTRSRT